MWEKGQGDTDQELRSDTGDASWEEWATSTWGCQGSPPNPRWWLEEGGAICLFQPPASPYRPGWTGGLVLLSAAHLLGKLSGRFCLQFSWNEAEFALSHLCVYVSIPSLCDHRFDLCDSWWAGFCEAGAHCSLCPCPLGPYVSMNLSSGPTTWTERPRWP